MNLELISQFVTILLVALFVIWFLTPLFKDIFGLNKKDTSIDIDNLIRKKESKLRREGHELATSNEKVDLVLLNNVLKERDSKRDQFFINLINSFQWGEGPEFRELINEINIESKTTIDPNSLITLIKFSIKELTKTFQNKEDIPETESLYDLLKKTLITRIALNNKIIALGSADDQDTLNYEKACLAIFMDNSLQQYSDLINDKPHRELTEEYLNKNISSLVFQLNLELKDYIALINEKAYLFSSLSPLEPLKDKKDIDQAYALLNLQKNTSLDDVKKKFKQIALQKHPDKFKSIKINKEIEEIVSQNFLIIKEAYELITERLSKREQNE